MTKSLPKQGKYKSIIEYIFLSKYLLDADNISFSNSDIENAVLALKISLPKNRYDVNYNLRFRANMPENVLNTAPPGKAWIIRIVGRSEYCFALVNDQPIAINSMLSATKIPDATPGIVAMYALNDEQALLTRVRYNRLIDIFTGITCYSLQNHLRTTVRLENTTYQVETDEIYVGIDRRGAHYIFPVQVKGGTDKMSVVQIEQDFALCADKFPTLICRPIGAQFTKNGLIALFEFELGEEGVTIAMERHYRLVKPETVTSEELEMYRNRLST
ncbi:MAG: endonuclease [Anaerolineae bacterium]|nr:endonuclease [Gloeobacterales cyanobacterium ES-bin-313]